MSTICIIKEEHRTLCRDRCSLKNKTVCVVDAAGRDWQRIGDDADFGGERARTTSRPDPMVLNVHLNPAVAALATLKN
jgi:hypothetical protein